MKAQRAKNNNLFKGKNMPGEDLTEEDLKEFNRNNVGLQATSMTEGVNDKQRELQNMKDNYLRNENEPELITNPMYKALKQKREMNNLLMRKRMPKALQQCDGCGCEKRALGNNAEQCVKQLKGGFGGMKVGCNPECGPCKDCKYPEYNN